MFRYVNNFLTVVIEKLSNAINKGTILLTLTEYNDYRRLGLGSNHNYNVQ